MYTNASQIERGLGTEFSKCTDTNAPGIGGLHGRKSGCPSSRTPVKRLQIGFVPKSGRLLPTRTTTVAGLLLPENKFNNKNVNKRKEQLNNNQNLGY